jgi:c-di-GMP-binding flagellar brake protein YcgR
MSADNVFTKVSTRGERIKIYETLIKDKGKVLCRGKGKKIIPLFPVEMKGASLILTSQEKIIMKDKENVILNFSCWDENFFLKTTLKQIGDEDFEASLDTDLFKIQRRDLYRVPIPPHLKTQVEVLSVNDHKIQATQLVLADLSGGGFAMETEIGQKFALQDGDKIECWLAIGDKLDRLVKGEIRYVKTVGSAGSGITRFGIKFTSLTEGEQQEITKLVMDIHREVFAKFK